jgi:hypothetical protein
VIESCPGSTVDLESLVRTAVFHFFASVLGRWAPERESVLSASGRARWPPPLRRSQARRASGPTRRNAAAPDAFSALRGIGVGARSNPWIALITLRVPSDYRIVPIADSEPADQVRRCKKSPAGRQGARPSVSDRRLCKTRRSRGQGSKVPVKRRSRGESLSDAMRCP